jgi:hypothetical protein
MYYFLKYMTYPSPLANPLLLISFCFTFLKTVLCSRFRTDVCRQTDSGVPGVGGGNVGPAADDWRAAPRLWCPVRYQAGPVRTSSRGTAVRGGNLTN